MYGELLCASVYSSKLPLERKAQSCRLLCVYISSSVVPLEGKVYSYRVFFALCCFACVLLYRFFGIYFENCCLCFLVLFVSGCKGAISLNKNLIKGRVGICDILRSNLNEKVMESQYIFYISKVRISLNLCYHAIYDLSPLLYGI